MSCHNLDECIIACPTCGNNNRRCPSAFLLLHSSHGQSSWAGHPQLPFLPPPTRHVCSLWLREHPSFALSVTSIFTIYLFQGIFRPLFRLYFQNIFKHKVFSQRMQLTANASINQKYLQHHPKAPQVKMQPEPETKPNPPSSSMVIHIADPNYSIRFYLFLIF